MKTRKVAIGVVYRKFPAGIRFLLLHRAKRKDCLWSGWEMPKGGIEAGESSLKTIKREVAEESGIKKMKVVKKLRIKVKYEYPKYWQKATGFKKTVQTPFLIEVFQNPRRLSAEFDGYAWCDFPTAMKKLKWKSQKELLEFARKERKTIVFDLDGVLLNSKRLYVDAFQLGFRKDGINLSKKLIASCLGGKFEETVKNIERSTGLRINVPLATRVVMDFTRKNAHTAKPVKGAKNAILKTKNAARIILLTNTTKDVAMISLKKIGLVVFDMMVFAEDSKNKESAIRHISREFKIPVKEIIYVGDMARDIRVARSAGCRIISVPGWDSKIKLKRMKPDVLLKNIGELAKVL